MSGETVYTLLFPWQEYADIKAEEEIILILNTRVTDVSRTVQDIDSGGNSSTVCFSFLHRCRDREFAVFSIRIICAKL